MESDSPLVSVVIPAFNRIRYIEETVRSVFSQTHPNVELIVVDDGSTDGTYEFLRKQSEAGNLTLLTHEGRANKGQSAALNVALRASNGKYICILDSDDVFLTNKLEDQALFLEKNPEVGLVYGMGEAIDEQGAWLYDIHSKDHREPNDPNAILLDCYMLLAVNPMVRKTVFDQVGFFDEKLRAAQDHDILLRIAEITRFAYIPEKVFQYRRHSDAISVRGTETRWRNGFEILRRARERYPYRASTVRKRKAVLNFRLAQTYLRQGKLVRVAPHLLKSGLLDPMRALLVLTGRERV